MIPGYRLSPQVLRKASISIVKELLQEDRWESVTEFYISLTLGL
jgi:hypothetical protein